MEKRIAIRRKLDFSSYQTFMRRKNLTLRLRLHMNHTYIYDMIICSSQEFYPESELDKSSFRMKTLNKIETTRLFPSNLKSSQDGL